MYNISYTSGSHSSAMFLRVAWLEFTDIWEALAATSNAQTISETSVTVHRTTRRIIPEGIRL
jgi:hypothetical protein